MREWVKCSVSKCLVGRLGERLVGIGGGELIVGGEGVGCGLVVGGEGVGGCGWMDGCWLRVGSWWGWGWRVWLIVCWVGV